MVSAMTVPPNPMATWLPSMLMSNALTTPGTFPIRVSKKVNFRSRVSAKLDTAQLQNLTFDPKSECLKLTLMISPFEEATAKADSLSGYHLRLHIPPPLVCSVKDCFNLSVRESLKKII